MHGPNNSIVSYQLVYHILYYPDFCKKFTYRHYSLCQYYNCPLKGTWIHYYKESLRSFNFTVSSFCSFSYVSALHSLILILYCNLFCWEITFHQLRGRAFQVAFLTLHKLSATTCMMYIIFLHCFHCHGACLLSAACVMFP